MDLIYTDKNRIDIAVLRNYELDFEVGTENTFQFKTTINNSVIPIGGYFYFENSEYGGRITTLKVDTEQKCLDYGGRTFYGMLCDKIICPDAGQDYYIVSGEANAIISGLIRRLGLSDLFLASDEDSGINFEYYHFERYIDAYTGLTKMLKSQNAKLKMQLDSHFVKVSAVPIDNYSSEEFSSDHVNFTISQNKAAVNHLICLGKGELAARKVIHLYTDADGDVSRIQHYKGLDEVVQTYDYSSVESEEELLRSGTDKLKELQQANEIEITIKNTEKDVGDIVGGIETVTGLNVQGFVTKKIMRVVNNKEPKFTYEIGFLN